MSAPTLPEWARATAKQSGRAFHHAPSQYGDAALTAECQRVASSASGTRNTTLNAATFALAQLVAGGELEETAVRRRLHGAAIAAGLEEAEILATLDSGFGAGVVAPRQAPQSERPPQTAARAPDEDDLPDLAPWPILSSNAAHGIVGRIAHLATAHSEADPAAVVATTIAYAAAEFGRSQFMRIGDSVHHSRHFNAIVGQSSRARKGTSLAPVQRIFERAAEIRTASSSLPFPSGCDLKVSHGPLSSGEGLIYAVRDGNDDPDNPDKGVIDKRLLVVEEELGSALRMFQRTGNSLSTTLRRIWDGNGTIAPMTKTNRLTATDVHVNIVGHITSPELQDLLKGSEIWNGFANRFQWLMARRPKTVPFPKAISEDQVEELALELARVITKAHANNGRELVMSNSAMDHWANVYVEITQDYPGILGAVTSRQEAHARRLALTYAQLDGADRIEIHHLEAALAFTRYAFDSAAYLFGGVELNPVALKVMDALSDGPKTQTEIRDVFQRNVPARDLATALRYLQERGKITLNEERTGGPGRPTRRWSRT